MNTESSRDIARRLFLRTTHGIKLGLDRMIAAADRIGNPQREYRGFHVAGTNGKGSVCAYLDSCLRRMGYRTGLFTSPHIVAFEERFVIDGRPVESEAWVEVYRDIEPVIADLDLTFFEVATLIAFELFKRERIQWAVFETGMGGRLDATNIVLPAVSVITRIAMDHMQFLGDDIVSIAREKLGMVKQGIPLVMAEPDMPAVAELALELCAKSGSICRFVSGKSAQPEDAPPGVGSRFTFHHRQFTLPLLGKYQVLNALLAITALENAGFEDREIMAEGLHAAFLPGRFQVVLVRGRTVVFDVGHNPDAAAAFVGAMKDLFPKKSVCIVTGIMTDKDAAGVLAQYCGIAKRIILTRPNVERSSSTRDLRSSLPREFPGDVCEIEAVSDAVAAALAEHEDVVCIVGSFFTVGEGMVALGIEPFK